MAQQITISDELLARLRRLAKKKTQSWLDKQGHDRCWYYPEIFTELARVLEGRRSAGSHTG